MDNKDLKCNKADMEDCRLNEKRTDFKMSHTKILTDKGQRYLKLTARNVFCDMKKKSEFDKHGEKSILC